VCHFLTSLFIEQSYPTVTSNGLWIDCEKLFILFDRSTLLVYMPMAHKRPETSEFLNKVYELQ